MDHTPTLSVVGFRRAAPRSVTVVYRRRYHCSRPALAVRRGRGVCGGRRQCRWSPDGCGSRRRGLGARAAVADPESDGNADAQRNSNPDCDGRAEPKPQRSGDSQCHADPDRDAPNGDTFTLSDAHADSNPPADRNRNHQGVTYLDGNPHAHGYPDTDLYRGADVDPYADVSADEHSDADADRTCDGHVDSDRFARGE